MLDATYQEPGYESVLREVISGIPSLSLRVLYSKLVSIESNYQLKVTFEVETVWKGVESTKGIIYTAKDGVACGVTYLEGKKYFVVANASQGKLYTDLCSWLLYSKNEKAFLKGLRKGKRPVAK